VERTAIAKNVEENHRHRLAAPQSASRRGRDRGRKLATVFELELFGAGVDQTFCDGIRCLLVRRNCFWLNQLNHKKARRES